MQIRSCATSAVIASTSCGEIRAIKQLPAGDAEQIERDRLPDGAARNAEIGGGKRTGESKVLGRGIAARALTCR